MITGSPPKIMPRSLFAAAPRLTLKTILKNGAKGMAILAKRRLVRNTKSLPLFEWADSNAADVFEPLLITGKLARQLDISPSVLNVMAAANGFKGREGSND